MDCRVEPGKDEEKIPRPSHRPSGDSPPRNGSQPRSRGWVPLAGREARHIARPPQFPPPRNRERDAASIDECRRISLTIPPVRLRLFAAAIAIFRRPLNQSAARGFS
jgi:hypothetical protein